MCVICIYVFMVDLTAIDWRDLHGFAPCLKHNGWWPIGIVNPRTNNLTSGHVTPSQITHNKKPNWGWFINVS